MVALMNKTLLKNPLRAISRLNGDVYKENER
jgi:hypothetical protein